MIAIPNLALGTTTSRQHQTGLTFAAAESWGESLSISLFFCIYLWAQKWRFDLLTLELDRKDTSYSLGLCGLFFWWELLGYLYATDSHQLPCKGFKNPYDNISAVAIGMMTTTFLQNCSFVKWIFSWLTHLFDSCCFSEYRCAYSICLPTFAPPPFILEWAWLYDLQKEKIYQYLTSLSLWNLFTLGATIPSHLTTPM